MAHQPSGVFAWVALLELPTEVQEAVRASQISTGHAKAIKGLPSADKQAIACRQVIATGMSVHATGQMVRQQVNAPSSPAPVAGGESPIQSGTSSPRPVADKTDHVHGIEQELAGKLGLKVAIKLKGPGKGALVISFENTDDFERVVELLRR